MLGRLKNTIKQQLVPKSKLVILNYHQVAENFDAKIHNKAICNDFSFFKAQMTFLKQHYKIVTLKEGVEALKTNSINETTVCLTFDDGDASINSLVIPLLEQLDLPATFFINTAYGIDKIGYWYNLGPYFEDSELIDAATEIRNTKDLSVYHQLLKLEDRSNEKNADLASPFYSDYKKFETCSNPLFHFGLHGHEHLRFSMLSYEQQRKNLEKNIQLMQDWPNYVPYFAIPFGQPKDWNKDTLMLAQELKLTPFLAYQGYNTAYRAPFLRFSVDGMDLRNVFKNFSPFQKTYDKLNNLKNQ